MRLCPTRSYYAGWAYARVHIGHIGHNVHTSGVYLAWLQAFDDYDKNKSGTIQTEYLAAALATINSATSPNLRALQL